MAYSTSLYWLIGSYRHEKIRNWRIEPDTGDLIVRIVQEAGLIDLDVRKYLSYHPIIPIRR